jgi:predicted GTPase
MDNAVLDSTEPLLRTLGPALRRLAGSLHAWLDHPRRNPLATMSQAALEGLAADVDRHAQALDAEQPLLVIVFMGGTGVGKSTLLNALAGDAVAQASFTRPTTREPVIYHHRSIQPERLDPALRQCRLVPHDRARLEQKILVDTPDLDSNDLENREKLSQVLPVADIILYVGSQEKYHDKLGWDLFLHQRQRRAFAFVLNKWDRCLSTARSGLRPDQDLLRDLQAEGFHQPLLFRICAEMHQGGAGSRGTVPSPDTSAELRKETLEGEQFGELVHWLEAGLTRLEIEAIKARGISQLLEHLHRALAESRPPDLTEEAAKTREAWNGLLRSEAGTTAEILLNTLEPFSDDIERQFAVEGQRRFQGLMATYLHWFTRARFVGSSLRQRFSILPRTSAASPVTWDLSAFTSACTRVAQEQHLDARVRALGNRLLVEANQNGFPVKLLAESIDEAGQVNWQKRYGELLVDVLHVVQQEWTRPTGTRRWLQSGTTWLANRLPLAVLFASLIVLLWRYTMQSQTPALGDVLVPVFVVFIVLVILHILITLVFPTRWPSMRGEFLRQLERRLREEFHHVYASIPDETAEALGRERQDTDALIAQVREIGAWLAQREQSADIAGLYGFPGDREHG